MPDDPVRVLVVDDSERDLRAVRVSLMSVADVVATAASGEEAISIAADTPFDAALVDYYMPGMDGIAVAERLKEIRPEAKVVILTALDDVQLKAESSPFVDHFHHKVLVDTLGDTLVELVRAGDGSSREPVRARRRWLRG